MRDDVQDLIARLESAVQRVTWALMDCVEDDLHTAPDEEAWSPIQIFTHIKACDDITTGRIPVFVTHPQPMIQNIDERAWASLAGYEEAPLDQTLMAFRRHRDEMVWLYKRLPDELWDRVGHHETRGDLTLFELLRAAIEHEDEHVAQLEAVFGDDEAVEEKEQ